MNEGQKEEDKEVKRNWKEGDILSTRRQNIGTASKQESREP